MDRTQQIMQKVRRIEMMARKLTTATFAGQYRSSFRGQGLDFDDFREYLPGDEPRFIDWKVTARTGTPYVRKFREEREQNLLLAVDASGSMGYASGGVKDTKLEYAALIAAVLAYSAAQNGDKVGLLRFGHQPHFYLPPAKGMKQCLRIVREIVSAPAQGSDDTVEAVADEILGTQRKSAMVFLISDFFAQPDKRAIGKLSFRHELIPVRVNDPAELELPEAGRVFLRDPETGEILAANLNAALRAKHAAAVEEHRRSWSRVFAQLGIDSLDLLTTQDFIPALRRLFAQRSRLFAR
ncbi:MAG TPA: DUF58 domain-containing protein [Candidatus Akkermansia intestinigallinarum]|uniref:DUF58 domain-containing protein n=1 Tax=Candidatus Akkermansia intestinigallinarum TaxID=2838431 RepID=A0A9D1VCT5_9BACT|nr:DUF58 domain-containing protein [Candidatus Akkermansia intestinigallinarum]